MSQRVITMSQLASTPATLTKPAKPGLLPVSPATIRRWVIESKFPKPFKLGTSATVWNLDEVESFIAQLAKDHEQ
jgi:predicted DNA-binding transcriptional regulator AlpA